MDTDYFFHCFGSAAPGPAFEKFLARLPPEQRARLRRWVDTPSARAFVAMEAAFRQHIAERRRQVDRAPLEAARAVASAKEKAAAREALDRKLVAVLAKSSRLLAELSSRRR
jgi:hypothetical protein